MLCVVGASLGIAMISPVLTSSLDLSGVLVGLAMVTLVWVLKDVASPFIGLSRKLASRPKKIASKPVVAEAATESDASPQVAGKTVAQIDESSSLEVDVDELPEELVDDDDPQVDEGDLAEVDSADGEDLTVEHSSADSDNLDGFLSGDDTGRSANPEPDDLEIDSGADDGDDGSEAGETEVQEG